MYNGQSVGEVAEARAARRDQEESAPSFGLKAEVLRALRPKLHCGVCEKPTTVLLNLGNVAMVCMECYDRFQASTEFYPGDVLHLEDESSMERDRR